MRQRYKVNADVKTAVIGLSLIDRLYACWWFAYQSAFTFGDATEVRWPQLVNVETSRIVNQFLKLFQRASVKKKSIEYFVNIKWNIR